MTDLALEFLSALEEEEARLLCWGYVDGGFDANEIIERAERFALTYDPGGETNGEELFDELRDRALILEVDRGDSVVLRSRMAETVRLAARLRQLFAQHGDQPGWRTANRLVSDYRLALRPRAYPQRNISPASAIASLADAGVEATLLTSAAALLSGRGPDFALSSFQLDGARSVFEGVASGADSATIVSAGTGAGKTLSFYLPALSHCAAQSAGTHVLALYPRIELLRDQFAAAFREAEVLAQAGTPMRLGALYGKTPHVPFLVTRMWDRIAGSTGYVCPFLRCPTCRDGELVWRDADREAGRELLVCAACHSATPEGRIALTRESLRNTPPHVLFTTTEMLNRSMADGGMRPLIGVGSGAQPVDLVLLDEVHTYEGTTGAHVSLLLRRWRHARRRRPVHFVGLSATLRDAAGFFGSLTGLSETRITAVEPRAEDTVAEGREYLLALRSDPTSGVGVLSTSIQTAMLLQRALDPMGNPPSGGAYGQRLFAFTDDLDVVNRFYFDLLDAEGLNYRGQPRPSVRPLASLRIPTTELRDRRADGQSWEALREIGHTLSPEERARVSRTTSQDSGVAPESTAVVATASLEVGFDDDRVGAVLQHKTPRGTASFLQRKGRAGRARGMRPWTVITLSDAGRDRVAYQRYEELFDPTLAPRVLPVRSPIVVRMQAVFVLTDWITERLDRRASTWAALQRPARENDRPAFRAYQDEVSDLLRRVSREPALRDELHRRLKYVLGIDDDIVDAVLWEAPRPLLTEVIPTAVRRLEREWRTLEPPGVDPVGAGPLPEFVVSRLFGDLYLPEVEVTSPPAWPGDEDNTTALALGLALASYAPARVSFRLTINNGFARHWVAPPALDNDACGVLGLSSFCAAFEELRPIDNAVGPLRVIRPTALHLSQPSDDIADSSHGRWRWERQIEPSSDGTSSDGIVTARLTGLVEELWWHLHADRREVVVRRYASEADVEILDGGGRTRGRISLADDAGRRIALGFDATVDGLSLTIRPPQALDALSAADQRFVRVDRLRDLVAQSTALDRYLGSFDRDKLVRAILMAAVERALSAGTDVATVAIDDRDAVLDDVKALLGQGANASGVDRRGAGRIASVLDEPDVHAELAAAVAALGEAIGPAWLPWLRSRWSATVGALIHRALQDLCPEFDVDDVLVELDENADGTFTVWLLESTLGGSGLLQTAVQRIVDEPRGFADLVLAGVLPGTAELVAADLERVADDLPEDEQLRSALGEFRTAATQTGREEAFEVLRRALSSAGVIASQPIVTAIAARYLRPGAGRASDDLTAQMLDQWRESEAQLGVEIDLAGFARLQADNAALDALTGGALPADRIRMWRASQAQSLLWPRGAAARRSSVVAPNRYTELPEADPRIVAATLEDGTHRIPLDEAERVFESGGALAVAGEALIEIGDRDPRATRELIVRLCTEAIETGAMLDHAKVQSVRRTGSGLELALTLDLSAGR